ncbi:MAG: aldose 1-epimerase family protein [Cyclobacteriaceae bacterium]
MVKHTIQNEQLTATITEKGAELTSLVGNDAEYIWQANATHWARHAPILFPFVGKLKNDQYHYQGNSYQMGQHGFARDRVFSVISQTANTISLLLKDDDASHKIYPFDFELIVSYALSGNTIKVGYQVSNPSNQTLYFSIGGHPAFNCPLAPGKQRSNYSLNFNQIENTEVHYLTDGLFAGATEPFEGDVLTLPENRFDRDALVFKSLRSASVSLMDNDQKTRLTFDYDGFPYLGIWSKNRSSNFVCIEPWFGIADQADHDGDITKKEGIMVIDGKAQFDCTYLITTF